jgi:hypothetical protein
MSESLLYREIQFSRLGGTLPEKIGFFVVGIPSEAVGAYRKEHPTDVTDRVFISLISANEHQQMKGMLGLSGPEPLYEQCPFDGEPLSLGTPTFEGEDGRKFWKLL